MKKVIGVLTAAVLAAGALSACGNSSKDSSTAETTTKESVSAVEETKATQTTVASEGEVTKIVVGASPSPHAEILAAAKELLAKEGYELVIKEYTDYVQPNNALDNGDLDANYFQHAPYLEQFNTQYGTKLVAAAAIHYEPFGIYAGKTASLDGLKEGAKVAVPNDVTNEARALLLLEAQGLITLKKGAGLTATKNDIVSNEKKLEIIEIEAAQIPRSLQDVDVAVINGNYAIEAGLQVTDALATEDAKSIAATTYGNIIAVKEGREKDDAILALVDAITSEEIKTMIEEKYLGAVVPLY